MQNDPPIGSLMLLIRFMEHVYVENLVLKELLATSLPGVDWRTELIQGMAASDPTDGRFAKLFASLESPEELHEAIQEFLSIKRTI